MTAAAPCRSHRLRRYVPAQYVLPLLLLLGSCFGCILALLIFTTATQNRMAQAREVGAVESAFRIGAQMVEHDLQDYAKWDDAVRHISRRLDARWVDDNITTYLGQTQGYTHILIVDSDDHTLYAYSNGRRAGTQAATVLGRSFRAALDALRTQPPGADLVARGYTRGAGGLYVFAVAAVVPLTARVSLPPGPPRMIVIAQQVDDAYLARLARDYRLPGLRLSTHATAPGVSRIMLAGTGGQPLGVVAWPASQPGTALRRQIMPAFVAIAAIAVLAACLILARGGRTIEALTQSEARALHHANHDPLTGLANRRLFVARIRAAIAEGRRVSLLYMDLDGFKDANDVYGHATGDALLREATARISAVAGDRVLAARTGGDEFALLLIDHSDAQAETLAAAIVTAFRAHFVIAGYNIGVGASLGFVSDTGDPPLTDDELMRRADVAMYDAKAAGKNRWRRYAPEMDREHDLRKRLEGDLRRAVAAGEIRVVYQPIIATVSGQVVGVEALARWTHPRDGPIAPDIFIPLAETSGVISALGRLVLERACRDAKGWGVCLAVNLSPAQFWDHSIVDEVAQILAATGFPAHRLELEITESYLMRRPEAAATVIDELRRLGIMLALDDFGAGFASVGYLRRLNFDRMKIDKTFVATIPEDGRAIEILAAIVALGSALGLTVTAEGVETQAQADVAGLIGCDRQQGWLYARPMPAAEIPGLLAASPSATPVALSA